MFTNQCLQLIEMYIPFMNKLFFNFHSSLYASSILEFVLKFYQIFYYYYI